MEENLFEQRIDTATLNDAVINIRNEIGKVIVGQHKMVDLLLIGLLCDGHIRSFLKPTVLYWYHLLLAVFFENTELEKITASPAKNVEEVYIKTIAEKFAFEKRLIAKELKKYGILSILTSPQKLTVNTINKYLELKARQAI